jgi:hypothetical protein
MGVPAPLRAGGRIDVLQSFIRHVPDRLGAHLVLAGPAVGSVSDDPESKPRPVLASRVGGIQDQVTHDRSGLLLEDPNNLAAFGRATATLLEDHGRAARLGPEGHRRVRQQGGRASRVMLVAHRRHGR